MKEKKGLHEYVAHPYQARNVNRIHKAEQQVEGVNTYIAVWLTKHTGSMWTAYLFTLLAFIGLFGLLGWLNPFIFLLATWVSQQFLQLILLPVIMTGQNVLSRHAELMAEEQFQTTQKSYHNLEQVALHLGKQDEELLRQTQLLMDITERIDKETLMLLDILERKAQRKGEAN